MTRLPVPAMARLPDTYNAAKEALATCARMDECQTWAKKAEAMASYAKQADDDSLFRLATKIKARAIKRCGELLQEIAPQQGQRTDQPRVGNGPKSRAEAARDAGLSERQRKTALRVAAVPDDEFEEWVESDTPPTITELAERGTKKTDYLQGRSKGDFQFSMRVAQRVSHLAEMTTSDPAAVRRGILLDDQRAEIRTKVSACIKWLTNLERILK